MRSITAYNSLTATTKGDRSPAISISSTSTHRTAPATALGGAAPQKAARTSRQLARA